MSVYHEHHVPEQEPSDPIKQARDGRLTCAAGEPGPLVGTVACAKLFQAQNDQMKAFDSITISPRLGMALQNKTWTEPSFNPIVAMDFGGECHHRAT